MAYYGKPITDRVPFADMVVLWTAEDLFPIPPTVTMYDSKNNNEPVIFQTHGHVSHGTKQYVLIQNEERGMAAIISMTEQEEMDIIFDQEKANEIAEWMDRLEADRQEDGVQIRDKFNPIVGDADRNVYRVSFAAVLNYKGVTYQVVAPMDNSDTILMCRLERDSIGGEDILRPETDEDTIRALFKQFFALLDQNRETAHGQETYDSFDSDDGDLFS